MREIATKKNLCLFKQTPIPAKDTFYITSRAFVSCLGSQHFTSDWLGKLKPNKLSTGCQNELKGAAVEKATNLGRRFLFFSRLHRSFSRASRENLAALPLVCPTQQNCHVMQAKVGFKGEKIAREIFFKARAIQQQNKLAYCVTSRNRQRPLW